MELSEKGSAPIDETASTLSRLTPSISSISNVSSETSQSLANAVPSSSNSYTSNSSSLSGAGGGGEQVKSKKKKNGKRPVSTGSHSTLSPAHLLHSIMSTEGKAVKHVMSLGQQGVSAGILPPMKRLSWSLFMAVFALCAMPPLVAVLCFSSMGGDWRSTGRRS